MRVIAHRANLDGPNPDLENDPEQIDNCIGLGLDVEVDIWYMPSMNQFSLGHDSAEYDVDLSWLLVRKENLWIHCKNIGALEKLTECGSELNYFWHEDDSYTLTSKGNIWSFPGSPLNKFSISVMPEWKKEKIEGVLEEEILGCCTDFPLRLVDG